MRCEGVNMETVASTETKKNESKLKKFALLLLMLIILLIPISFWFGIIKDRESYRNDAVRSVASAWGNEQVFSAPQMYFEQNKDKELEKKYLTLNNYFADIKIKTEIRQKGIYKVPVYTADVVLKGDFLNNYDLTGKSITTEFKVKDSAGFIEEPAFKINGEKEVFAQDTKFTAKFNKVGNSIPFEINYKIRGIDEVRAGLGGLTNNVFISGDWPDPSFIGNFLPSERNVEKNDFAAKWSVPKIATTNIADNLGGEAQVGVSFLTPVDNYRMAYRALRYAFLFITLTFISYFIFEITKNSKRIHPLQYLLLGGAMLIFYLLLVSISEIVPFIYAYLTAGIMTIGLLGGYTYFVITRKQDLKFTVLITALLTLLYTFLYILLTVQDLALLIGSLGLFIIIALIMYATRNVDWEN